MRMRTRVCTGLLKMPVETSSLPCITARGNPTCTETSDAPTAHPLLVLASAGVEKVSMMKSSNSNDIRRSQASPTWNSRFSAEFRLALCLLSRFGYTALSLRWLGGGILGGKVCLGYPRRATEGVWWQSLNAIPSNSYPASVRDAPLRRSAPGVRQDTDRREGYSAPRKQSRSNF